VVPRGIETADARTNGIQLFARYLSGSVAPHSATTEMCNATARRATRSAANDLICLGELYYAMRYRPAWLVGGIKSPWRRKRPLCEGGRTSEPISPL
jgi:hypothetical protein